MTTLRLPPELEERVARAAERAGTTPHALILDAIAEKAGRDELRSDFHESAEKRYAAIAASGKAVTWAQMREYLQLRIAGNKSAHPKARKIAR